MLRNDVVGDVVVEGAVVPDDAPVLKWQPRPGSLNATSLTLGEGSGAMWPAGCVVVDVAGDVVVVAPGGAVVVVAFTKVVVVDVVAECDVGLYFS
jgi:hypothetical protein